MFKFFSTWAILGFAFVITASTPKKKIWAILYLIMSGPLCWVMFIIASADLLITKKMHLSSWQGYRQHPQEPGAFSPQGGEVIWTDHKFTN